jgi:hypothetical protein
MSSDDWEEIILLEYLLYRVETKLVWTFSFYILWIFHMSSFLVSARVRPKKIAQKARKWRLYESIDLVDIFDGLELRWDTSMHTQIISVDVSCQRHGFKRFYELFIDWFISSIFIQNFLSKSKMFRHGPAFMISSK